MLQVADNATVILDDQNEVQPDVLLRILPVFGGQTKTSEKGYVTGPPEWIGEIAHSSVSVFADQLVVLVQPTAVGTIGSMDVDHS